MGRPNKHQNSNMRKCISQTQTLLLNSTVKCFILSWNLGIECGSLGIEKSWKMYGISMESFVGPLNKETNDYNMFEFDKCIYNTSKL